MNKKGSYKFVMFIIILLINISFIALIPYLYPTVTLTKEAITCSDSYTLECFILDLTFPVVVIVLVSMLIGFVTGGVKK